MRPGFIPQPEYDRVRELVPIACVDLLPVQAGREGNECLLIRRSERGARDGWALIGGRIEIDESIGDAAARHLTETLGQSARIGGDVDWGTPDAVAEYSRGDGTGQTGTFDPEQHSIALTYRIRIEVPDSRSGEAPEAHGEALEARWFPAAAIPGPDSVVFGQHGLISHLTAD